jgi:geranylgeranyl diphosphate synthase type I
MAVSNDIDLARLVADTEAEILRVVGERDESTAPVYEMIRYHLGLDHADGPRGKRMRPLLGLLAYASIAGEHARALPGAAAVELGHNFSLVHDDIEDGDVERRHRATLWAKHGVPQAINTGDLIFSLSRVALHRLSDLGFSDAKVLRLMRLYDQTCVKLCEGQYLDIAFSASDEPMPVERYFDMIGRKTAALISASIEAGALLATDDEDVIATYRRFGWALGIAFQLNDDLLGIWGDEAATGKVPTDLARHKKTLPVLYALEHATGADRERLTALYASTGPSDADLVEMASLIERAGGQRFTRDEARRYRNEALTELDAMTVIDPAARDRLRGIILGVITA